MEIKSFLSSVFAFLGLGYSCSHQNCQNLDVSGFDEIIKSSEVVLLDVRSPQEYSGGHISGAVNIDVNGDDFLSSVEQLVDKNKTVAVYCRSGRRSSLAANQLAKAGYKVVNLKGGIESWKSSDKAVVQNDYERDVFKTSSGKTIEFYALMHACIRIVYNGLEIEIDPVSELGDRKVDYSSFPKADYILVTHEHKDHFDESAISVLSSDKTKLVTNSRCAEMLKKGEVMKNGDKMDLGNGLKLEAVPAYNTSEGRQMFHPKGRDNGFILTIDGIRIYIAGDTEDIPEMEGLGSIDIAFMPCNQPYTMTTNQLFNAARMVSPKVLFPYHYGNTDLTGVKETLKADGIDVRIRHYE